MSSGFSSSNFHGVTPLKYRLVRYMVWLLSPVLAFWPSWKTGINNVDKAGRELAEVALGERWRGVEGYVYTDKEELEEQAGISKDEVWGGKLWEASLRWVDVGDGEVEGVFR
jgi:hypothetical protein